MPVSLTKPLWAGAAARTVAALCAVSFFARDDYFHVLAPALAWLDDPTYDWDHSQAAGAGLRSHLFPRLVWGVLWLLRAVGVTTPTARLQAVMLVMGALSLALVPAMAEAGRRAFNATTGVRAAWLAALFFVFPYAGTRLLIEGLAMAPLVAGVALCDSPRPRDALIAGIALGMAIWWRYPSAAVLLAVLPLMWRRQGGWQVATMLAGLTTVIVCEGFFDLVTTGSFLGPLWRNIAFNLHPPAHLSRSAPWGSLGFWLLMTLPPCTLLVGPAMLRAARRAPMLAGAWLAFVAVHAFIPHKEDRFYLPALPLFMVLVAAAPDFVPSSLQRFKRVATGCYLALAAVLLALGITAESQANLRDAMLRLRNDPTAAGIVSLGPELQTFFLDRPELPTAQRKTATLDETWLRVTVFAMGAQGTPANRFLAFAADRQLAEVQLKLLGRVCEEPEQVDGWWLDRMLARLNRRNKRRGPVLIYRCDTVQMAGHTGSGAGKAGLASR